MKQWSEIIRNVTMLSQLREQESGAGFSSPVFSLVWEAPEQWPINFIFLLTDSRGKRKKEEKIRCRLTDIHKKI